MPSRDLPARRNLRLHGWDYRTPGYYAITVVSQNRECLFGHVDNADMVLNRAGLMVGTVWREMAFEFPRITLDDFVVMPNHVHAVLHLSRKGPAGNPTLGDVVQRFKTFTTVRYSAGVHE